MNRITPTYGTIFGIVLLLVGVFLLSDHSTLSRVLAAAGIAAGFGIVCGGFGSDQFPGPCRIGFAMIVLFVFWILNPIAAAFLIGAVYLAVYYLSRFLGSENELRPFHVAAIGVSIAVLLAATPVTVSRVILHYLDMPVATKISLENAPGARRGHLVSKSFPNPYLVPVHLALNANNVTLSEPMPFVKMTPRRDTEMTLHMIHYKLFHATIDRLRAQELHHIELSDRSDEVTLRKVKNGLLITDIGDGEAAWLKLPDIDPDNLKPKTTGKAIAMKLFIWILICVAFWVWAPRPGFKA